MAQAEVSSCDVKQKNFRRFQNESDERWFAITDLGHGVNLIDSPIMYCLLFFIWIWNESWIDSFG